MAQTATHLIAEAAKYSPVATGILGKCRACGIHGSGPPFEEWLKPTFTDGDKLKPGNIICHACDFCFTDQNQVLGECLGHSEAKRFRNYSHFVSGDIWTPVSKADKRGMFRLLVDAPCTAVVALSGQKHLAFRCPAGWWQIEEQTVRPFPSELAATVSLCTALYEGGISKTEIETGRYLPHRIVAFGYDGWRQIDALLQPLRGSLRLLLALFLTQKTEEDDGSTGDCE